MTTNATSDTAAVMGYDPGFGNTKVCSSSRASISSGVNSIVNIVNLAAVEPEVQYVSIRRKRKVKIHPVWSIVHTTLVASLVLYRQDDPHGRLQAGHTLDRQFSPVQFGQTFSNRQPQALTLLFVLFTFELHVGAHLRNLRARHPAPPIHDRENQDALILRGALNPHRGSGRGITERVIEQLFGDLA